MRFRSGSIAYLVLMQSFLLPAQEAVAPKLNIVIVEGEGAINNIRQRTAREPIVQVEDHNRKPVAGAAVVFLLPSDGASGTFTGGSKTLTVMTDQNGRAVARGLRPNNVAGQMQIRVSASFQGQTGSAVINQTNAAAAVGVAAGGSGISVKLIAILAGIGGAAAAGGIIAATRGGNGTPAGPPPATVTPGVGTVGAPR